MTSLGSIKHTLSMALALRSTSHRCLPHLRPMAEQQTAPLGGDSTGRESRKGQRGQLSLLYNVWGLGWPDANAAADLGWNHLEASSLAHQ